MLGAGEKGERDYTIIVLCLFFHQQLGIFIRNWLLVFHSQDVLSKRTKRFNSFFPLLHQTGIRKYNFWLSNFINVTFYIDQRICSNNLIILPLKLFSYNSLNRIVLFPTREVIKVWQFLMFSQFFYFATLET